jgi:hypothetical protein
MLLVQQYHLHSFGMKLTVWAATALLLLPAGVHG